MFKAGQSVIIRPYDEVLKLCDRQIRFGVSPDMIKFSNKYQNKVVTISNVFDVGSLVVEEDEGCWAWEERWFKPLNTSVLRI